MSDRNRLSNGQPRTGVIWSDDLLKYRWNPHHPMNPVRLSLTMELARSVGVLDGVELRPGASVDDALLRTVHSQDYIDAVRAAPTASESARRLFEIAYGLGNADNPIFAGMHEGGALMVGATMAGARMIADGSATRAVSIGGGLHHAMPGSASGFCVYNDCAIAITELLQRYDRIAYIDIDAHHGDGVQHVFLNDPRVLTISLHQDPATLFPGTGFPQEVGEGDAAGRAVNVALPPGTVDSLWLRAFHAVVPGLIREFAPQVIVSQCGADSHRDDPLTDLSLTVEGQRAAMCAMRDLAEKYCDGRWLAVGGGGYGIIDVVPRSWTHLLAVALDRDLDPATPTGEEWRAHAQLVAADLHPDLRAEPPTTLGDGGTVDYVPWDGGGGGDAPPGIAHDEQLRVDGAITATRKAVWPLLGLDPEDPRD